ncbi:hypothetical protein H7100_01060 [Candidatus Saccharibacteria bacterium]|nr:hypothetical protein [Candidatus Saccharibacteria bacterium]
MPRISKKKQLTQKERFTVALKKPFSIINARTKGLMARRPHRSFRITRRRDYNRSLKLPGYFAFTRSVNKTLLMHKKVFLILAVVYALLMTILVGIGSQETYNTLATTLQSTGSDIFNGNIGQIGQAALLFVSISSSGLNANPTEAQQIYIVLIGLLVWLTTVWLLRHLVAGHKVRLRDGLYGAGAPIIATFLVMLVLVVQLLPAALAAIGYGAATATGLLSGGVAAMLFWIVASLLVVMSLYWITSTFFALIIVTLPGMYPLKALRTAGDMVVGRRLRILLRILWMIGALLAAGVIVFIPVILIDTGLTNIWPVVATIPIVPVTLTLFSVVSFIWSASYVYLLYRKVVDDDAKPA